MVLGVEAVWRVELHLEPLPLRCHPAGVDTLVLGIGPVVLGVVHLVAVVFEPFLEGYSGDSVEVQGYHG